MWVFQSKSERPGFEFLLRYAETTASSDSESDGLIDALQDLDGAELDERRHAGRRRMACLPTDGETDAKIRALAAAMQA